MRNRYVLLMIAAAVAAMVTMPRGAHMRSVEVEAEGAVSDKKRQAVQEKGTDG